MTQDEAQTVGQESEPRWLRWIRRGGVWLAVGGTIAWLLSALATGWGLLHFGLSLRIAAICFFAALLGVLLLVIALIWMVVGRKRGHLTGVLVGLVLGGLFAAYFGSWLNQATKVPQIHDITTDLTNPPEFEQLELRADNREVVPDGGRADLAAVDNAMRWRMLHAEAYGDVQPLTVAASVPDTIAAAEELVRERGWEIAVADPASGRLEATETVSLYRFKDDVVLRVTPNPDGQGSIVDMRSVSRVGVSDLGVNANRIRDFLADLEARLR